MLPIDKIRSTECKELKRWPNCSYAYPVTSAESSYASVQYMCWYSLNEVQMRFLFVCHNTISRLVQNVLSMTTPISSDLIGPVRTRDHFTLLIRILSNMAVHFVGGKD